jgi:hypothetical protein
MVRFFKREPLMSRKPASMPQRWGEFRSNFLLFLAPQATAPLKENPSRVAVNASGPTSLDTAEG